MNPQQNPWYQVGSVVADVINLLMGNNRQPSPREQELGIAGNGACLIISAFEVFARMRYYVDTTYQTYFLLGCVCVFLWGIYWFCIGAARSQGPRDVRIIIRAAIMIAIWFGIGEMRWPVSNYLDLSPYVGIAIGFLTMWMIVSACVQIGLVMRGHPPQNVGTDISGMPHGGANFGDGGGFR